MVDGIRLSAEERRLVERALVGGDAEFVRSHRFIREKLKIGVFLSESRGEEFQVEGFAREHGVSEVMVRALLVSGVFKQELSELVRGYWLAGGDGALIQEALRQLRVKVEAGNMAAIQLVLKLGGLLDRGGGGRGKGDRGEKVVGLVDAVVTGLDEEEGVGVGGEDGADGEEG